MIAPRIVVFVVVLLLPGVGAFADEGMWTYNNFPTEKVQKAYGFTPSDAWMEHLRLSSVRFGGASGSFVSPNGLVMTNHHVGERCIQDLGTAERNLNETGYYAPAQDKELRCPQMELNVLTGIADVTGEVNAGVKPDMDAAARNAAQRAATARLEKECRDKTGLRCDVVVLYEGGAFNLYRYKKYTDVRLVFAPEASIAFFGGDPDNFTYPRYDLDITFFRVYENNKPAPVEHYLKWSAAGPRDGELVFVSGHPGSTGRNLTMSQLEFLRDVAYPARLKIYKERLAKLFAYSRTNAEQARIARDIIFGYENSQKGTIGYQSGLLDKKLMARRAAMEKDLQAQVAADPNKQKQYGGVWEALAGAQRAYASFYHQHQLLDGAIGLPQSRLFQIARRLVRLPAEKAKPNEKRLREYRESALESLLQQLYSPAPIYESREILILGQILSELQQTLGAGSPLMKQALAGETPEQAAGRYVTGSKLADVKERRRLADGGQAAIDKSDDAMIRLAKLVDSEARTLNKRYEDEVEALERKNGSLLAQALFALRGTSLYPEATGTLRLSYGAVKGYVESGKKIPYTTTFDGMYKHATGKDPYKLPDRYLANKAKLNLSVPLNFASTNDIIGGNSGSPVVNKAGELVGIIFDSNIQGLPNRFLFTDEIARAVSVHSAGIIEALEKIYGADAVVKELRGR